MQVVDDGGARGYGLLRGPEVLLAGFTAVRDGSGMSLDEFQILPLRGGFLLVRVVLASGPMTDALGRVALARTTITGSNLEIELAGASAEAAEFSISLYHEVLEAAAVAALHPPPAVCELNEAGFEAAALDCHQRLGPDLSKRPHF